MQINFTSFDEIRKELGKLSSEDYTFDQFQSFKQWCITQEETVKQLINKLTVPQLKKIAYMHSGDTKATIVKSLYESVLSSFHITSESIGFVIGGTDTYRSILEKKLASITAEDFDKWKAGKLAERAALKKSLDNPETLAEFRTFIRYRGERAMTTEQRAAYDALIADSRKEQRAAEEERKAVVKQVDIGDTRMELKNSFHAKKQIPIFVVQLTDRVERDVYEQLNQRAKKLGGYYSSYRGGGAIPGFVFEDEKSATLFMQVKDGDVSTAEQQAERKEEKVKSRAEVMRERGEKLVEQGEEELNRDRKANTARRARFAASAESKAAGTIELGKTFIRIAKELEAGTIKYLENLSSGTELNLLDNILHRARYNMATQLQIRSESIDENDIRLVDFIQYPWPYVYKNNVWNELHKLKAVKGRQLAAARIIKRLSHVKDQDIINFSHKWELEDFETVFCSTAIGVWDQYRVARYKEELLNYKRVHDRLKLETINELRAALRELIQIRSGAELSEDQKRMLKIRNLEREFVGKKIDGFFPTPRPLAFSIVNKAGIEPGDRILEPSAGLGHIAEVISELYPDNELACIEQYYPLVEALKLKGFEVVHQDFLQLAPGGEGFDKIIMNPPFENGQDNRHVQHAFSLLKPGGRLVAIVAGNKNNSRNEGFTNWVEEMGGYIEENPAGSFESAFRPTGVNTCTVVLDKPVEQPKPQPAIQEKKAPVPVYREVPLFEM